MGAPAKKEVYASTFFLEVCKMKLEEMLELKPSETLLLVIDVQRDFMEVTSGFTFFDANDHNADMCSMVVEHLIPLVQRSLEEKAHVVYVQAIYKEGKFLPPYDQLCSKSPGKDFCIIDNVHGINKVRIFEKHEYDPFTNPDLRRFIDENRVKALILTGVTLTHCISAATDSALLIPNLAVVVPEDCVGYRHQREADAQRILDGYKAGNRVVVVNSGQIKYK